MMFKVSAIVHVSRYPMLDLLSWCRWLMVKDQRALSFCLTQAYVLSTFIPPAINHGVWKLESLSGVTCQTRR